FEVEDDAVARQGLRLLLRAGVRARHVKDAATRPNLGHDDSPSAGVFCTTATLTSRGAPIPRSKQRGKGGARIYPKTQLISIGPGVASDSRNAFTKASMSRTVRPGTPKPLAMASKSRDGRLSSVRSLPAPSSAPPARMSSIWSTAYLSLARMI